MSLRRTLACAALTLPPAMLLPLVSAHAETATPTVVARVVAGYADVRDSSGNVWTARKGLVGDFRDSRTLAGTDVTGTDDDALYAVQTFGTTGYALPVGAGRYRVRLLLAEDFYTQGGRRVFDVTAEGAPALTGVDAAGAVGRAAAYERSFEVEVTDGTLNVGFAKVLDNPQFAAIEVTRVGDVTATPSSTTTPATTTPATTTPATTTPAPAPTSAPSPNATTATVVARAAAAYTDVRDGAGNVWAARKGFVGGSRDSRTLAGTDVTGTTDDVLYAVQTFGTTGYTLPVTDGRYRVRLLMAEDYWTKAGGRVFDVTAQGTTVLKGVDAAGAVGRGAAYERSFEVDVTGGTLNVGFVKVADNPQFAAIEVARVSATAPTTTSTPAPTTATTTAPAPTTATTTAPTYELLTPVSDPTTTTTPTTSAPAPTTSAPAPVTGRAPIPLHPQSPWITRIEDAPLDPASPAMSAALAYDVTSRWNGVAAFNAYHFNDAFYAVPAGQRRIDVDFWNCQGKTWIDPSLTSGPSYFLQVPVPDDAIPANGTDAEMSIYDASSDQLWEFWGMRRNTTTQRWEACWGGRIDKVSTNMGLFPQWYGATGTGVAMAAGMISLDDVRKGRIDHAMYLAVPTAQAYPTLSWPALRTDGNVVDGNVVREGQRVRLDPSLDLSTLKLTPLGRMIAEAAQKYGFIVSDRAGSVAVITESGDREKALTGTDPWAALLGGKQTYEVLAGFPWDKAQVVAADHGKPSDEALASPKPILPTLTVAPR